MNRLTRQPRRFLWLVWSFCLLLVILVVLAWCGSKPSPVMGEEVQTEGQVGHAGSSGEIPWQGLNILEDWTVVYLDPGFSATFRSVMACESRGDPRAIGTAGERGLLQIHAIHQGRIVAMGYTWDQMLEPGPNLLVAESIWKESGWRPWSCKPQWRADGTSGAW